MYWYPAMTLVRGGLRSLGVLAAQRGLELIAATSDPDDVAEDLRKLIDEGKRGLDTTEVSPHAASALREALRTDFDNPREELVAMAHRVVPELATTRVKELAPMPEPAALVVIGRRLRPFVDALEQRTCVDGLASARAEPVVPAVRRMLAQKLA